MKKTTFSRPQLAIFVLVFALIGFLIYKSFAAAPLVASLESEQMSLPYGASVINDSTASAGKALQLLNNGTTTGSVSFPSSVSSLTLMAKGDQCNGAPAMTVALDGTNLLTNTAVSSTTWSAFSFTPSSAVAAGTHSLSVSFANDYTASTRHGHKTTSCDRNLYLDVTNFYGPIPVSNPAPTVSLSATPTSVAAGSASTLTWGSTNADSCTASGAWSGTQPTAGSTSTGALNQNSTYTLTCSGAGGSASGSATVSVSASAISMVSSSITAGQTLSGTVSWTVTTTGSVAKVEFWANNAKLGEVINGPSSFVYPLDTTKLPDGANALGVAIDGTDGSRITPQIGTITVNNTSGSNPGTIIWNGDFETGNLSQYSDSTQCMPGQSTVISGAVASGTNGPTAPLQGSHYWQSLTKNGDNIVGGERCEIIKSGLNISNGVDQYYGWSVFMPSTLPANGLTGQFHGTYDYNQANLQWFIDHGQVGAFGATSSSPRWEVGVNGGSASNTVCPSGQYVNSACSKAFDLGLLSSWEGRWINVAVHIKWQDTATGTVELWMKKPGDAAYTKYISQVGNVANLWQGYTAYLKLGINRTQNSGLPDAYIWYDNVRQGTTFDSIAQ